MNFDYVCYSFSRLFGKKIASIPKIKSFKPKQNKIIQAFNNWISEAENDLHGK